MFRLTILIDPGSLDEGAEQEIYVRWPFIPRVGESIDIEKFPGHSRAVELRIMGVAYDFEEETSYVLEGQSTKAEKAGELGRLLTQSELHLALMPTTITILAANVAHVDFNSKGRYIGGSE